MITCLSYNNLLRKKMKGLCIMNTKTWKRANIPNSSRNITNSIIKLNASSWVSFCFREMMCCCSFLSLLSSVFSLATCLFCRKFGEILHNDNKYSTAKGAYLRIAWCVIHFYCSRKTLQASSLMKEKINLEWELL